MIHLKGVKCNNYSEKITKDGTFSRLCPECGCKTTHIHQYYDKNVIYENDELLVVEVLKIMVLYCPICKHSNAILPYDVIGYDKVNYELYVKLLTLYYGENSELTKFLEKDEECAISTEMIERIVKHYEAIIKNIYLILIMVLIPVSYNNMVREILAVLLEPKLYEKYLQIHNKTIFMRKNATRTYKKNSKIITEPVNVYIRE